MSERDDLERRLEEWLHDTAQPMPPDLFDEIVATAPRVPRAGVRAAFPSGGRWRLSIAAIAGVVMVAVAIAAALRAPLGPGATGSPVAPSIASFTASSPASPPVASPPASTSPTESHLVGEWHRNNYNAGEERLVCREGSDSWTCTYELPDATGSFVGQNVTDSWMCPDWFTSAICDNATAVFRGVFLCCLPGEDQPPAGTPGTVRQEFVITDVADEEVLQLYWVDQFVCPWYRTSEAALAADFNCVVAP